MKKLKRAEEIYEIPEEFLKHSGESKSVAFFKQVGDKANKLFDIMYSKEKRVKYFLS
jgi:hypothetical protein